MNLTAKTGQRLLIGLAVLGYALVLFRTAWLSDDAYITLRTVDNFNNGYGLRWNVAERVQAYTHPLWLFLLAGVYFFTHEAFYTTIFLSLILSIATILIVAFGLARSTPAAILGVLILTLSKAFTDYSTSGLENPLTHLILAAFLLIYFRWELNPKKLLWLSVLAGLGVLNRMDTLLLFLPVLAYTLFKLRSWRALALAFLGFSPFILWEGFSLFYYGFLFPNTAYAKLNIGVTRPELIERGLAYLANSFELDPLTLGVIAGVGLILLLLRHSLGPNLLVALGAVLYLVYLITIGGDFMSGRFLTAPLLIPVILLVRHHWPVQPTLIWAALAAVVLGVGLTKPYAPPFSDITYGADTDNYVVDFSADNGIVDERAFYYPGSGLLPVLADVAQPRDVSELKNRDPVQVYHVVGHLGFAAGPEIHLIDTYALADPFLARLPVLRDTQWRIGHFWRRLPEGYEDTIRSGQNKIRDENLALYYDKLKTVISGDLFDPQRLGEIWRLNTGQYDYLLDRYPQPKSLPLTLSEINDATSHDFINGHNLADYSNFQLDFEQPRHAKQIAVQLRPNPAHHINYEEESYQLIYYRGDTPVDYQIAWLFFLQALPESGVTSMLTVPEHAVAQGYDRIQIFPAQEDTLQDTFIYNIAAVHLVE
jgi:arabinofuranosyltransferase